MTTEVCYGYVFGCMCTACRVREAWEMPDALREAGQENNDAR